MNTISFHLKGAADRQLPQTLRQPRQWHQVPVTDQNLMTLFAEIKSSGSPATFRRYVRVVTQLMMWLDKPLAELNSRDLRQYQVFLADPAPAFRTLTEGAFRPALDKTIDDTFVVLRLFCSFLVNEGVIAQNPAQNVKPLARGHQTETQNFFTPYKWDLLQHTLAHLPTGTLGERRYAQRMRYCIAVEYGLALRPDEMAHHHQGMIYQSDHGRYKIDIHGKGNKTRTLPIDDITLAAMQNYQQAIIKEPSHHSQHALPFLPRINPIRSRGRGASKTITLLSGTSESAWQKTFKQFMKTCFSQEFNIPLSEVDSHLSWQKEWAHLSPYALRHTRLSHLLLRERLEIIRVKEFAGHAHLSTTEQYIHLEAHTTPP